MSSIFGEVIHSYTRADMIADGDLIDVTQTAKEAGFKVPVALTKAVYEGYVVPSADDVKNGQDEAGRLWDTLWMLMLRIKTGKNGVVVQFPVVYVMGGKEEPQILKAVSHPGDNHEHVITIMLPSED